MACLEVAMLEFATVHAALPDLEWWVKAASDEDLARLLVGSEI